MFENVVFRVKTWFKVMVRVKDCGHGRDQAFHFNDKVGLRNYGSGCPTVGPLCVCVCAVHVDDSL